jgi:N-acetylneuraminic acid mutarotase
MKWSNCTKIRFVLVGFVAAVLLNGGVRVKAGEESHEGMWMLKTDMPTARFIAGSAVVDGKIYVVGGAPRSGGITNIVEEYDPAADTWTRRANMPTSRQGVCAAAVDGIVYAIGGNGGAHNNVNFATVEAYDPTTDTWTKKTDMPTPRTLMAVVTADGKIYVMGGDEQTDPLPFEVYDPATDTWTRKADMPTARFALAADVVDGKIYVFGGGRRWATVPPLNVTPIVEVYDPATDTWTRASDMPRARFCHSASAVDGKIYIIGGEDPAVQTPSSEGFLIVDVYDPATDTWTTAADLPAGGLQHTASVVDGKIYTFGRWMGPGGRIFPTVQEFTPPEAKYIVLNVPDESPGPPSYADIGRDFIPADGTQVAIVFMRDPACIPPEFNLLDTMDLPAAFECPFLLGGQEWWYEPLVDFPFKCVYVLDNDGSVPVYFVDLAELNSEIADDQLTLGELEAFSSLKVGQATYVKNDILNSNAPDSDGKGHGVMTAIGTLQESGEFFYVHWHEEFRPEIGKNVFLDTVIRFFPGAN